MDETDLLRQYGERARREKPLHVDVPDDVLATIRRRERAETTGLSLRPLVMAAAASALLAVTLGVAAHQTLDGLEDPVGALASPFTVTMQ
jgi:hypothetical protein